MSLKNLFDEWPSKTVINRKPLTWEDTEVVPAHTLVKGDPFYHPITGDLCITTDEYYWPALILSSGLLIEGDWLYDYDVRTSNAYVVKERGDG